MMLSTFSYAYLPSVHLCRVLVKVFGLLFNWIVCFAVFDVELCICWITFFILNVSFEIMFSVVYLPILLILLFKEKF